MKPLTPIAIDMLPSLAKRLGSGKSDLETRVGSIVRDTLGTDDPNEALRALSQPALASELRMRLAEIDVQAEVEEKKIEKAARAVELEQLISQQDLINARLNELEAKHAALPTGVKKNDEVPLNSANANEASSAKGNEATAAGPQASHAELDAQILARQHAADVVVILGASVPSVVVSENTTPLLLDDRAIDELRMGFGEGDADVAQAVSAALGLALALKPILAAGGKVFVEVDGKCSEIKVDL